MEEFQIFVKLFMQKCSQERFCYLSSEGINNVGKIVIR